MAEFLTAYHNTKKWEGGYTDHPDDNGNWTGGRKGSGKLIGTNKGISAPQLMKYLGRVPTVQDMKFISDDTVKAIYKNNFWVPVRGDEIRWQMHANSIYDSAVNMGPKQAIILAQRAAGLPETGRMNQQLLNHINNQSV